MKRSFLFKRGKFYHLQYQDENSRKRRISTGRSKKNEALAFVSEFRKHLENKSKPKILLLSEVIKEYEDHLTANFSRSYLAAVRIHLRRFKEFIGDKPLQTITVNEIEKFLSKLADEGKLKPAKYLVSIKTFLNKALSWGYLNQNPAQKIKVPKNPQKAPLFISEVELTKIMDLEPNENLKDIYFILFHTGMRLGELINLKWNQVNLADRVIRVANTADFTTKGKKERSIPINEKLYQVLRGRYPQIIVINQLNYIFTVNGRKYNGDYISKSFKKIIRKMTNIDKQIHLHSLRHSFASNLVQRGVSLFIVKELLGHQSISTTQIYSHLTVDSLREAVKLLES